MEHLVRLSSAGHCPSRVIAVTEEELARLKKIERQHGYLDAGYEVNKEFLDGIYARPAAGPKITNIMKCC